MRELRNLVERLAVMTEGEEIALPHVLAELPGAAAGDHAPTPRTNEELKALKRRVHERASGALERAFVLEALRRNDWNVTRAARETGMLRPNFHALMRKHRVRAEEG